MVMCDLYLKRFDLTKGLFFDSFSITVWYKLCLYDHSELELKPFHHQWIGRQNRRENGKNVISFRAWPLWPATWVGCELGGSAPHQCRWAGCCLGAALSRLCVGCCRVWSFFHWLLFSSWTVTLIILGLGFLRARLLRLWCTAAFPPIFLQLRKGPLWSCAELLQSDSWSLSHLGYLYSGTTPVMIKLDHNRSCPWV